MKRYSNNFISKIFLITYSLVVFSTIVFHDSSIVYTDGLLSKVYVAIEFLGIFINAIIFCFLVKNKLFRNLVVLLFTVLFLMRIFMDYRLITPFFFLLILIAINSSLVHFPTLIKTDFCIRLFSILVVFLLFILGLLPSNLENNEIISSSGRIRYSLGFFHPNELGLVILSLFISGTILIYFIDKRKRLDFYFGLFIVYIIMSFICGSRNFIISTAIIMASLPLLKYKYYKGFIRFFSLISIPASFIFSIYCSFYSNENSYTYSILNTLLSNRLHDIQGALAIYPPKLSGYTTTLIDPYTLSSTKGVTGFNVDNEYIKLILGIGILGLILYILMTILMSIFAFKSKNTILCIFIIILAICSITEDPNDVFFAFVMIYAGYFNFNRIKSNKKYLKNS